jgi:hypothetical protein
VFTFKVTAMSEYSESLLHSRQGVAVVPLGVSLTLVVAAGVVVMAAGWVYHSRQRTRQAVLSLDASRKAHNAIVGYVCHELRNPLHVLESWFTTVIATRAVKAGIQVTPVVAANTQSTVQQAQEAAQCSDSVSATATSVVPGTTVTVGRGTGTTQLPPISLGASSRPASRRGSDSNIILVAEKGTFSRVTTQSEPDLVASAAQDPMSGPRPEERVEVDSQELEEIVKEKTPPQQTTKTVDGPERSSAAG